ncbi:MAG: nucleotide exchange factor GrpE [Planctomycetota bacterium]|nr:nucleotide exchange factor GrpE [Planctomycetota bacterium]
MTDQVEPQEAPVEREEEKANDETSPEEDAPVTVDSPESEHDGEVEEDDAGDLHDKWMRAKAEVENIRRRSRLDVEEVRRYGSAPLLHSLLSILDGLQRALASPPEDSDESYIEGLRLLEQQWVDVLASYGVKPVTVKKGSPLDPSVHRALREEAAEDVEPGQIVEELLPGYLLHDRLLREAQVSVAPSPKKEE